MTRRIAHNQLQDGIDRRGFLECMAWVGTGLVYTMSGGFLRSEVMADGRNPGKTESSNGGFTFVQISDSHIGFSKEANKDVTATLQEAVSRINALPERPDFIIHTGDLTHLSKTPEFDLLEQVLKGGKVSQVFFVPGEHDVLSDDGASYLERFGKQTRGTGWYSFDHKGVHFIRLVNVLQLRPGGLGLLGAAQLEWLEDDLRGLTSSTPIRVIRSHTSLDDLPRLGVGH